MSASSAAIDAALSGYDAVVSPDRGDDSPSARRRRMLALEREFASDVSDSADDDGDDVARRRASGAGYDDSEDEAWAALRGDARAAKAITGSAVVRRSRAARYDSESDGDNLEDLKAFEAYVAGVRREPSRAMRGVRAARKYEKLVSDELEDSARKAMERVEYKVERYEDESAAFVRKNLNAALEESALSAEERDAFRVKAQRVLERQTNAFEQVLDATDMAFSGRLNAVDVERERVRQRFGDDYESGYALAKDAGFDMDLKVGISGGGIPFVGGIIFKPIGVAFELTKFAVGVPLNILGAPLNVLGRLTGVIKEKKRVEDDQTPSMFEAQMSPTKLRRVAPSVPSSPGARSDISSLNGSRRWPVGAAAQRVPGAQRRYSVAGSVRSMATKHTLYTELDDVSEDDEEVEIPTKNKLTRAVVRLIQLGCLSAVVSLTLGPGERAKRTRAIVEDIQRKLQRKVSAMLMAFLARWSKVSSKLSAPQKPAPKRKTASVAAPEVIPIQVPSIIPLSADAQGLPSDISDEEAMARGVTFANVAALDGDTVARMSKAQAADLRKAYGRG